MLVHKFHRATVIEGDVREALRELPDESVDCIVTSPPYFNIRDFGLKPSVWGGKEGCDHDWQPAALWVLRKMGRNSVSRYVTHPSAGEVCARCEAWRGELGQEPESGMFIEHLAGVCAELKRVLRRTGTFWLNIGDSYAGSVQGNPSVEALSRRRNILKDCRGIARRIVAMAQGYRPRDVLGIPWRLALRLQQQGWILRQEIIWYKPAALQMGIGRRLRRTHEQIFLLTKTDGKYYWNQTTEPAFLPHDVWVINPDFTPRGHPAPFPEELVERCLYWGCPPGGTVLDPFAGCGTTARVALRTGRYAIMIEANSDFVAQVIASLNVQIELPLGAEHAGPSRRPTEE